MNFGFAAVLFERNGNFLRQFVNAVAVGTVCRHGNVQHDVVVAECNQRVYTEFRTFRKAQDIALFLPFDVIDGKPHFFQSAEHTFGQHSAQFAALYGVSVGKHRSVQRDRDRFTAFHGYVGDYLQHFGTDISFCDAQSVGVGVLFHRKDFADDDFVHFFGLINYVLHLEPYRNEFARQSFGRNGNVYVIFEP